MLHFVFRLAVALATFWAGVTSAQLTDRMFFAGSAGPAVGGEAEQAVLRAEREYLRAHVERDPAALERVLADEFTLGPIYGEVVTKPSRLRLLADSDFAFRAIDTDDVRVTVNGGTALVTGTAVLTARYGERVVVSPRYGFAREYAFRDGRWQVVSVRITRSHRR